MNSINLFSACLVILIVTVTAHPYGHAESYANFNQHLDEHEHNEHFEEEEIHHPVSESYANFHQDHHDFEEHSFEGEHEESHHSPAKYSYDYSVFDNHSGDHKNAWEVRDGDKVTGMYSFYEPDGIRRDVHYTADKLHGFQAVVKRVKPDGTILGENDN